MQFKVEPYQWQLKAIEMSKHHRHLALLCDMGTGKSSALVNILRVKYTEQKRIMKTVIFSPLVTLYNWRDEFQKHSNIPFNKIGVVYGPSKQKIKIIEDKNHEILIMNYEGILSDDVFKAIEKFGIEIAVLDEAHYCKNYKSKRAKQMFAITRGCDHRYIMTGTPMTNSVEDFFMQYKILDDGRTFGDNFFAFQRTYMKDANDAWKGKKNYFPKWVAREDKLKELYDKVYSIAMRVTKDECMDLPPFIEEIYSVPLSKKQADIYKMMERDFFAIVEAEGKKSASIAQIALTKGLRLQQIVSGFITNDEGVDIEIDDNPRLDAVEELVESLYRNHKVIIWCSFKNNYKQLGRLLDKMKVNHVYITGDMNLDEKRAAMNAFNEDDKVRVVVANRKAGGIGVNLIAASYSIVYSRNFSLEEDLQSRDRNYRGGSQIHERVVRINLSAIGTIDEVVTKAILGKKNLSDAILNFKGE